MRKWRLSVLEKVEQELNKWSFGDSVPEPHLSLGYPVPVLSGLGNSTIADHSQDAFNLNAPVAGHIKVEYAKDKSQLGSIIIVRSIYGYVAALKALEKKDPTLILLLAKEMVETLKKDRGFGPEKLNMGTYGKFLRPGGNKEYFRDSENYAGFELRLYSATTLSEKL